MTDWVSRAGNPALRSKLLESRRPTMQFSFEIRVTAGLRLAA